MDRSDQINIPMDSTDPPDPGISYREILTLIVKRFARLMGMPAALAVTRKVPRLVVDDDGNIVDYNTQDPIGTITHLIDQFEVLYGEVARTLIVQAAGSDTGFTNSSILKEVGLGVPPEEPARILIGTDHVLLREGLVSLLDSYPQFDVVGQAGTVGDTFTLARSLRPQLVLLGMNMPDGTGVDATKAILAELPSAKIVILTSRENSELLFAAIRSGAVGYVSRNESAAELFKTLQGVVRGEAGVSGTTARQILNEFTRLTPAASSDEVTLTSREVEILRELANGSSNREIAQRLVISENTVKNHVRNVLVKLHFHSRREAADYARKRGLGTRLPPT